MRLLIADDDKDSAEAFAHYVRMRFGNVECFFARTLGEALAKRREVHGLDAIVFDLSFPDAKPEAAIDSIHSFAPVPVFVLTGVEDKELFRKALEKGAKNCFLKGTSASALASSLAILVYQSKPSERLEMVEPLFNARRELARQDATNGPKHGWIKRHSQELLVIVTVGAFALPYVRDMISGMGSRDTDMVLMKANHKTLNDKVDNMKLENEKHFDKIDNKLDALLRQTK